MNESLVLFALLIVALSATLAGFWLGVMTERKRNVAKVLRLHLTLVKHHNWRIDETKPDPERGLDSSNEYGISRLYEETTEVLYR